MSRIKKRGDDGHLYWVAVDPPAITRDEAWSNFWEFFATEYARHILDGDEQAQSRAS